jgi:hypothetical protein
VETVGSIVRAAAFITRAIKVPSAVTSARGKPATGQEVFTATDLSSCVYSVAMTPDGTRIVAA